jgi:hypothetical protein
MDKNDTIKLLFDFFKHLSTLDTACILLMAGLIERVFPHPIGSSYVEWMFSCFVLSLLGSLTTMFCIILAPDKPGNDKFFQVFAVSLLCSILGFLGGLFLAAKVIYSQNAVDKQNAVNVTFLEWNEYHDCPYLENKTQTT